MPYSENALNVYKKLYFRPGDDDDPHKVHARVARFAALGNGELEERLTRWMDEGYMRPNTPTLMNAGYLPEPQTSACFLGLLDDDLSSILNFQREAGLIYNKGSGIGGVYGNLREAGAPLSKSGGTSSGPISFLINSVLLGTTIKSGGRRRAAHMGMMKDWHPDLIDWINLKADDRYRIVLDGKESSLFDGVNLSIAASNAFMEAAIAGRPWELRGVVDGEAKKTVNAAEVLDLMAANACKCGDPGIWFVDRANEDNTLPSLGRLEGTNPCVTSDTLVAVADGRGYVSIGKLADEGKDVLVHCVDPVTRRSYVRMGRNPRLTRRSVQIFKVIMDDDSFMRVTGDHRFLSFEGNDVKTLDLIPGTRLLSFIRYQAPNTSSGKMYWYTISRGEERGQYPEHQMIVSYFTDRPSINHIPHHKNGNSLDNTPSNIEWLSVSEHNKVESSICNRSGTANGMFGKKHSAKTKGLIGQKSRERFLDSDYRRTFATAVKDGIAKNDVANKLRGPRVDRIRCACATCGSNMFVTEHELVSRKTLNRYGLVFCSLSCSVKYRHSMGDMPIKAMPKDIAIKYGKKFVEETGNLPSYASWDRWRGGDRSIPSRELIRTRFGGFQGFSEVVAASLQPENHKVVSVEPDGVEDVYNITVDEFHTVAYVTNTEAKTRSLGRPKHWGVYTRQCSEQHLLPRQSCALASINLAKFVEAGGFNWTEFGRCISDTTSMQDNLIDISGYPTSEYLDMALDSRPIGIGLMGLADALLLLDIPYDSNVGVEWAGKFALFLTDRVIRRSAELAKEKGPFNYYGGNHDRILEVASKFVSGDIIKDIKKYGLRNSQFTTLAPTGSVSISCDCSPGMEPLFAITYGKRLADSNEIWQFVNPIFGQRYSNKPWYAKAIQEISDNHGSCRGCPSVPVDVQNLFVTAHDINWRDRIAIQAALQRGISNGISSTINLPAGTSPEEVKQIYIEAWRAGLKGITVYVDGCKSNQPVVFGGEKKEEVKSVEKERLKPLDIVPLKRGEIVERPKVLDGSTFCYRTGCGKTYISVNHLAGEIMEAFANPSAGGGCQALIRGLSTIVSMAIRGGLDPALIACKLNKIICPSCRGKEVDVKSCPAAIAKAIMEFSREHDDWDDGSADEFLDEIEDPTPLEWREAMHNMDGYEIDTGLLAVHDACSDSTHCTPVKNPCPDCGAELMPAEGCFTCRVCGFSKCS